MNLEQLNKALLMVSNLIKDEKETNIIINESCIEVQVLEDNSRIEVATIFCANKAGAVEVSITHTHIL